MCLVQSKYQGYEQARKRAWYAVRKAISHGILIRPDYCCECGQIPERDALGRTRIEAHHYLGYAAIHRLDVVFICDECHHQIHDEIESFRATYYQEV